MRINDYKKRAARAAEKWERLHLQEQTEKNDIPEKDSLIGKLQESSTQEKSNPVTSVKGIRISQKVIKKIEPQEVRDSA